MSGEAAVSAADRPDLSPERNVRILPTRRKVVAEQGSASEIHPS